MTMIYKNSDPTPTDEQLAIREAVRNTSDNIIIQALAGAAKTSTLVLIAKATSSVPTLALSFNAMIAKEMRTRLPGNCESLTLNSIGHRTWGRTIGRNLSINKDKVYDLTTEYITRESNAETKTHLYEVMSETMKYIRQGKSGGWIPQNTYDMARALMTDDEFFEGLSEEPSDAQIDLIRAVTKKSIDQSFHGECDYDDQVLMPTVFPSSFPQYPQVLIDESQDLSDLNLEMLKKIAKKRLIGVGDECQGIYAFRGARNGAMDLMKKQFNMTPFVLSISFRCPQSVVKEAHWRTPHMRWPEWAKEGTVRSLAGWTADDLPQECVVLCRNNAPLFQMALRLLRNGRFAEIVGSDMAKQISKILSKLGPLSLTREEVITAINTWRDEKLEKSREKGKIMDMAQCLRVFAEAGTNLADAIAFAEHIFRQSSPIKLMTGHKSKGLEFEDVFILDRHLIDEKNKESQDRNLLYVMQTRAKSSLTYIESERFVDNV